MTGIRRMTRFVACVVVAIVVLPGIRGFEGIAGAVPPPAPVLSSPANAASVTIPATISWSQVAGAGGYNWEISSSSGFTTVIERNPSLLIGAATTQDVVSGLANGTYFWRSQAVSPDLEPGAWSSPRSFTVTGAGPGAAWHGNAEPASERNPVPLVGEHHLHVERRTRSGFVHPPGIDRSELPHRHARAAGQHSRPNRSDLVQPEHPGKFQGTRHRGERQRRDGNAVEPRRLQCRR